MAANEDDEPILLTAIRVEHPRDFEIRPAAVEREWMSEGEARFSRNCLPLLIANQAGWEVMNPVAFTVVWDGGNGLGAIRLVSSEPIPWVSSHFGFGIITWQLPYLFRTSPGYNLLARGPANRPKDGIAALEGVCETDWASQTFTMNWKFTRVGAPVTFAAGEPFLLLQPMLRGQLERVRPTIVGEEMAEPGLINRYVTWRDVRKEFNGRLRIREVKGHQLHYLRGRHIDDAQAPEHQTRLRLASVSDQRTNHPLGPEGPGAPGVPGPPGLPG